MRVLSATSPLCSPIYVCILGQNCLVNLYLLERLRRDRFLECVCLEDLLGTPPRNQNPILFLLDLSDMTIPLSKCIQILGERFPGGKYLVVSRALSVDQISAFHELGIDGFMEYEDVQEHLATAIQEIRVGETWCSPTLDQADRSALKELARKHSGDRSALTCREGDIVQLARQRLTNKEIACLLKIEESTVKFHLGNIFGKLNISTRDKLLEPSRTNQALSRFLSGDFPPILGPPLPPKHPPKHSGLEGIDLNVGVGK